MLGVLVRWLLEKRGKWPPHPVVMTIILLVVLAAGLYSLATGQFSAAGVALFMLVSGSVTLMRSVMKDPVHRREQDRDRRIAVRRQRREAEMDRRRTID